MKMMISSISPPCIIAALFCFLTGSITNILSNSVQILVTSAASISVIQLNPDQPRFYPANTYDTYATTALRTAVQGTTTYAFGVWFKPIAYPATGTSALVFTMTMLK